MTFYRTIMRKLRGLAAHAPGMITCREFEAFIIDYLEGNLPAPRRRLFEFHLRFCPECRLYLSAYKHTMVLGKAVFEDPEASVLDRAPEALIKAILDARQHDQKDD
jgi:anti-sigma factor RsiW